MAYVMGHGLDFTVKGDGSSNITRQEPLERGEPRPPTEGAALLLGLQKTVVAPLFRVACTTAHENHSTLLQLIQSLNFVSHSSMGLNYRLSVELRNSGRQ